MSNTKMEAKTKLVDDMFHAWLISHGMGCDDEGKLHYRSKEGDLAGIVPADEFRSLFEDPEHGFEATVKQKFPDIEFTLLWTPPELQEQAAAALTNGGQKKNT